MISKIVWFMVLLVVWPCLAAAQQSRDESIEIGLSTDRIAITADFSGADLTIFGALDNADPLVVRQGRYDVIVVLQGPASDTIVRRKERFFGVWINRTSQAFENVPISYSLATTRAIQDIADGETFARLSLGIDKIFLKPANPDTDAARTPEFTSALREGKRDEGLYSERVGGVQFLSQSLFRATLSLPAHVPVGTHRARAFLFRNGVFLKETSAPLLIMKSGFEEAVFQAAHTYGFAYGLGAVFIAMLIGWLGRIIFRKD